MLYKTLLLALSLSGVVLTAHAQIGWTPQRMQKEYGMAVVTRMTNRLTSAKYKSIHGRSILLTQLGGTDLNVTFLDGKVVELFIAPCKNITKDQFAAIAPPMIDANAKQKDIKWSPSAFEKGFLMIYCHGYMAGYFANSGGSISIGPMADTPLNSTLLEEKIKSDR